MAERGPKSTVSTIVSKVANEVLIFMEVLKMIKNLLDKDVPVGQHTSENVCDIHSYGDLKGKMETTLYQEGEPRGYLNAAKKAVMKVKFCLEGHLRYHLCGWLCVSVHVECLGPGQEIKLDKVLKEMDPCGDGCYEFEIEIPPNSLTPNPDEVCGQVCCFAVTLSSLTPECNGKKRPGHIYCYSVGPCVMIHPEPN